MRQTDHRRVASATPGPREPARSSRDFWGQEAAGPHRAGDRRPPMRHGHSGGRACVTTQSCRRPATTAAVFRRRRALRVSRGDPVRAIDWFRTLAAAKTPHSRRRASAAGSQSDEGGQVDAALATYASWRRSAHRGSRDFRPRCSRWRRAVEFWKRPDDSRTPTAAQALRTGLTTGAWPILRDADDSTWRKRAAGPENGETEAERTPARSRRRSRPTYRAMGDRRRRAPEAVRSSRKAARSARECRQSAPTCRPLVAGADFLQDGGRLDEARRSARRRTRVIDSGEGCRDGSAPQAVRTADASKLPWTLRVTSNGLESDSGDRELARDAAQREAGAASKEKQHHRQPHELDAPPRGRVAPNPDSRPLLVTRSVQGNLVASAVRTACRASPPRSVPRIT